MPGRTAVVLAHVWEVQSTTWNWRVLKLGGPLEAVCSITSQKSISAGCLSATEGSAALGIIDSGS